MTTKNKFIAFIFMALMTFNTAEAREVEGIAAIVNDEVISKFDVDQRVNLFLVTSGIERTRQNIDGLRRQVLRTLIQEKLQLQEARDSEIEISLAEINAAMQDMASGTNRSLDEVKKFLKENNVHIRTMEDQIEAELAWNRFVRGRFGGQVSIGELEIDETLERAEAAMNQDRVNISEILLLANNQLDGQRLMSEAAQIVQQLRAGINFGAVARQFSAASSSASGGNLGWIPVNQLDENIVPIIENMAAGDISDPIETSAGIYIVQLNSKQQSGGIDPMRNLFDLLIITYDVATEGHLAKLESLLDSFTTCKNTEAKAKEMNARDVTRTGQVELRRFPKNLQSEISTKEAGQVIGPKKNEKIAEMVVVCDRKDDQGATISRDTIENNLYSQRLAIMARRHLRELRRDSIVEYR
ncbi:MAG: peptidylprolyl isomerase [Candidatus Micropelagos thuwalensis]|nr:peptidylprolyl isomerase [Candidatus Micropelagos thuwalensis]